MTYYMKTLPSPVGNIKLVASDKGLAAILWENDSPIAIIAPCHRVIGANGTLTGFAGGLEAKECLLTIEHNHDFKGKKAA